MTMTDPIADLLTRIRNGQHAGHKSIKVSLSKEKKAVVAILKSEGFVEDYHEIPGTPRGLLEVTLKYDRENKGAIHELKRASTPGRRVYVGAKEIPQVKSGLGVSIVSTPRGIMADHMARKENVGGELICTVW